MFSALKSFLARIKPASNDSQVEIRFISKESALDSARQTSQNWSRVKEAIEGFEKFIADVLPGLLDTAVKKEVNYSGKCLDWVYCVDILDSFTKSMDGKGFDVRFVEDWDDYDSTGYLSIKVKGSDRD